MVGIAQRGFNVVWLGVLFVGVWRMARQKIEYLESNLTRRVDDCCNKGNMEEVVGNLSSLPQPSLRGF